MAQGNEKVAILLLKSGSSLYTANVVCVGWGQVRVRVSYGQRYDAVPITALKTRFVLYTPNVVCVCVCVCVYLCWVRGSLGLGAGLGVFVCGMEDLES